MKKLRLGLIGCGRIAQAHLEAAADLGDQVELVALADIELEKARAIGARLGIDRCVRDYRELLDDPRVEAVVICLPHHLHHAATIDAIRAGKHILLEKPMSLTGREAEAMVAAARRRDLALMIGQSRRFSRAVLTLRERLPAIGPVIRIIVNFLVYFPEPPTGWWSIETESGELITYLQASHSVDFALWMLGRTPERVFARTFSRNAKGFKIKDEEDIVLEFRGAVSACFHLSLNTKPAVHETIVVGEQGSLRWTEYSLGRPFAFGNRLCLNDEVLLDGEEVPSNYTRQMGEFLAAVREKRPPAASGEEVADVIRVLEAITRSARSGRVVRL